MVMIHTQQILTNKMQPITKKTVSEHTIVNLRKFSKPKVFVGWPHLRKPQNTKAYSLKNDPIKLLTLTFNKSLSGRWALYLKNSFITVGTITKHLNLPNVTKNWPTSTLLLTATLTRFIRSNSNNPKQYICVKRAGFIWAANTLRLFYTTKTSSASTRTQPTIILNPTAFLNRSAQTRPKKSIKKWLKKKYTNLNKF